MEKIFSATGSAALNSKITGKKDRSAKDAKNANKTSA
jgi:hypothetical protein